MVLFVFILNTFYVYLTCLKISFTNMKTKIIGIAIVLLLGGSLVWHNQTKQDTFRIGALLCLTAPCEEWGENSLDGIMLAAEEINASGGILGKQIEIVVEDSAEDNIANSVNAYKALRSKNIEYIIGPTWSAAGQALGPIAAKDKVLITSPSLGVRDFNEAGTNIFNIWPHDELATRALAKFAFEKGHRKIAIVSSKESWYLVQGNAFEDEFVKLGGTVLIKDEIPTDRTDVRTDAAKIFALKPDLIAYSNFENMGLVAHELSVLGYTGAQVSVLMDESRIDQGRGAFEGTVLVQYAKPSQEFINAYKNKFGKEPGITADTGYDALKIYAQIINEAGRDDLSEVNKIFADLKTYPGASGELTFDGKGGVTKPPVFYVVKGTQFVEYK